MSALKESVKSMLLIEMHLLFTFADPLFQHYARFFEIKFSIKDKDSPPKVGKSFFSSKERERGGGLISK